MTRDPLVFLLRNIIFLIMGMILDTLSIQIMGITEVPKSP